MGAGVLSAAFETIGWQLGGIRRSGLPFPPRICAGLAPEGLTRGSGRPEPGFPLHARTAEAVVRACGEKRMAVSPFSADPLAAIRQLLVPAATLARTLKALRASGVTVTRVA